MSETLHVIGFPHTQTNPSYATCAYTQRVVKFCRMMTGRDRKVILYSGDNNEAPCDEHVNVFPEARRQHYFGDHDESDLDRAGFQWGPELPYWMEFNAGVVGGLASRIETTDLICLSQGLSQKLVADIFPSNIVAEIMVGYRGILADRTKPSPAYAAFESQSHRAMVYGEHGWQNIPRAFDCVIPNQFDPDELPYGEGGDYLLFVGRLIPLKGIEVACRVADHLEMKLVVAGPGAVEVGNGYLVAKEGRWQCRRMEYVGPVGVEERAQLMGGAAATMVPTLYAEPFGGVAVESMMTGTPVVTTDFGAFTDTVEEGVSGYRFQTLQEAVDATENAMALDRKGVRNHAMWNYSLDVVAPQYQRWFDNLDSLWDPPGGGFMRLRERELRA